MNFELSFLSNQFCILKCLTFLEKICNFLFLRLGCRPFCSENIKSIYNEILLNFFLKIRSFVFFHTDLSKSRSSSSVLCWRRSAISSSSSLVAGLFVLKTSKIFIMRFCLPFHKQIICFFFIQTSLNHDLPPPPQSSFHPLSLPF